jgi:hypothetical protein
VPRNESTAHIAFLLLQLRILRLGFLEDGDVGVGVFSDVDKSPPCLHRLGEVEIEAVYFLRAFVPHQKRCVIRPQAYPGFPGIETARHFLETKKTFYFPIALLTRTKSSPLSR